MKLAALPFPKPTGFVILSDNANSFGGLDSLLNLWVLLLIPRHTIVIIVS